MQRVVINRLDRVITSSHGESVSGGRVRRKA
jgi:hypothetical protein